MILILTHDRDLTPDLVIRHLERKQASYIRLNTDRLGTLSCHFGMSQGTPVLKVGNRTYRALEIRSVWSRRFAMPAVLAHHDPKHVPFVQRELAFAMEAFVESTAGFQVNPLDADRLAGNRLLQSSVAQKRRLSVPRTLVTQDPEEARAFQATWGSAVIKAISYGLLTSDDGIESVAYTSEIDLSTSVEGATTCPILLQERIPKRHDWRVTTVGDKVFAAKTKQDLADFELDWRKLENPQEAFESGRLPERVRSALVEMCRDTGLRFACHDLIETPDGEFYFLETNPAGQWGWLEIHNGLPIGEALADHLMSGE